MYLIYYVYFISVNDYVLSCIGGAILSMKQHNDKKCQTIKHSEWYDKESDSVARHKRVDYFISIYLPPPISSSKPSYPADVITSSHRPINHK